MSDIAQVTDASYQSEVLDADGPVIVDFWAPWCGPCRAMEPVLKGLADQNPGAKFAKLNVDDNPATAARYEILSIPTLLVLRDGEVEKKLIGAMSASRLRSELAPWLENAAA